MYITTTCIRRGLGMPFSRVVVLNEIFSKKVLFALISSPNTLHRKCMKFAGVGGAGRQIPLTWYLPPPSPSYTLVTCQ